MIISLIVGAALAKKPPPPPPEPAYQDVIAALVGDALVQDQAWTDLVYLSTQIGARFAGSPALDRASAWGLERMAAYGLQNVHPEPATLKAWSRGTLEIVATVPYARPVHGLSLGGSLGTPAGGVEGDVVVVDSWEAFEALPDERVAGRIVVWNAPFTNYGETVAYRFAGASVASRRGAVASLVRSVSPSSLDTPHTGVQRYDEDVAPIPAVAITLEDANWLALLQTQGVVPHLRLTSTATPVPDVQANNVLGEVRGRELPDEIVVLGCHLDSWDVGQGAQDDGAGCVQALTAAALIAKQPVPPRRTVRVVFFVGEEYGIGGAHAYAEAHQAEKTFAAIEADTGAGHPFGFRVDVRKPGSTDEEPDPELVAAAIARVSQVRGPLAALEMGQFEAGYGGTDIGPLIERGALGFGVWHDTTGYWPVHHTHADTIDKVDPNDLDAGVAAMALLGWTLAELP